MKKVVCIVSMLLLVCAAGVAVSEEDDDEGGGSKAEKREKIDAMATEALEQVFSKSEGSKDLYEKSFGYAVFDNLKISFGISGGGGHGVAVARETAESTYMKMGTGGVGIGLGGKKYQIVFLFEDQKNFDKFVTSGWDADAQASAAAGTDGADARTTFRNGVAVWQLTDKGLVASADVSGTKYWKNKKLNN